jgi:hypothetical protein
MVAAAVKMSFGSYPNRLEASNPLAEIPGIGKAQRARR